MSQDGLTALEAELGAKPPGGLAQLTAEHQRALAQAIRDARHRQAAELTAAGDQALQALRAALAEMSDADLLHVAFVLEPKDRLGRLMTLLPAQRRDSLVDVAAAEDLWPELLPLIPELPADAQERVARAAAKIEPSLQTLDDLLGEPGRRRVTERQVQRRL